MNEPTETRPSRGTEPLAPQRSQRAASRFPRTEEGGLRAGLPAGLARRRLNVWLFPGLPPRAPRPDRPPQHPAQPRGPAQEPAPTAPLPTGAGPAPSGNQAAGPRPAPSRPERSRRRRPLQLGEADWPPQAPLAKVQSGRQAFLELRAAAAGPNSPCSTKAAAQWRHLPGGLGSDPRGVPPSRIRHFHTHTRPCAHSTRRPSTQAGTPAEQMPGRGGQRRGCRTRGH